MSPDYPKKYLGTMKKQKKDISVTKTRSHLVLQIMAFQCFKIQLQKIESAPENFGEHNVTGILVHISATALMWTQSIDVSSGLNYLHNNGGKTWFSFSENREDCDVSPLLMEIRIVNHHL